MWNVNLVKVMTKVMMFTKVKAEQFNCTDEQGNAGEGVHNRLRSDDERLDDVAKHWTTK